ncbi:MAG: flagellar basal body-associated FliL family protein [bacterium]
MAGEEEILQPQPPPAPAVEGRILPTSTTVLRWIIILVAVSTLGIGSSYIIIQRYLDDRYHRALERGPKVSDPYETFASFDLGEFRSNLADREEPHYIIVGIRVVFDKSRAVEIGRELEERKGKLADIVSLVLTTYKYEDLLYNPNPKELRGISVDDPEEMERLRDEVQGIESLRRELKYRFSRALVNRIHDVVFTFFAVH